MIALAVIEHAIAKDDGSLEIYFPSKRIVTLTAQEAASLEKNLKEGLARAQHLQAIAAAKQMGIITH